MSQKYVNGIIEQDNGINSSYRENAVVDNLTSNPITGACEGYNSVTVKDNSLVPAGGKSGDVLTKVGNNIEWVRPTMRIMSQAEIETMF